MIIAEVSKSDLKDKKYKIVVIKDSKKKTLHIGQASASDYTKHKDPERKERYTDRHRSREDWSKSGVSTAGFWAKHLLWNKPSITESIKDIEKRFNLDIKKK